VGSGLPWSWRIGGGYVGERAHVREMLPEVPAGAILAGDAGMVGFDLIRTAQAEGLHMLVRVGRNVRLLTRLGQVREHDGIVIYPIHSPALVEFDDRPELWLDVRWDLENTPTAIYSTQIVVTLLNEPGALGVIATTIGEYGANIDAVATSPSGADFRRFVIDLQVRDIQHLNAVLSELRGKSVVNKVERASG